MEALLLCLCTFLLTLKHRTMQCIIQIREKHMLKINTEKSIMLHWGLFLLNFPKVNVNKILKENLFVI